MICKITSNSQNYQTFLQLKQDLIKVLKVIKQINQRTDFYSPQRYLPKSTSLVRPSVSATISSFFRLSSILFLASARLSASRCVSSAVSRLTRPSRSTQLAITKIKDYCVHKLYNHNKLKNKKQLCTDNIYTHYRLCPKMSQQHLSWRGGEVEVIYKPSLDP